MQHIIAIGMVPIIALIVVSLVVTNLRKLSQSNQKWIKVMAMVIAVEKGQGWKDGERLIRDPWSDGWVLEKTWQSYCIVTAQWISPQTQDRFLFSGQCWADETTTPVVGTTILVITHSCDPSRHKMIF